MDNNLSLINEVYVNHIYQIIKDSYNKDRYYIGDEYELCSNVYCDFLRSKDYWIFDEDKLKKDFKTLEGYLKWEDEQKDNVLNYYLTHKTVDNFLDKDLYKNIIDDSYNCGYPLTSNYVTNYLFIVLTINNKEYNNFLYSNIINTIKYSDINNFIKTKFQNVKDIFKIVFTYILEYFEKKFNISITPNDFQKTAILLGAIGTSRLYEKLKNNYQELNGYYNIYINLLINNKIIKDKDSFKIDYIKGLNKYTIEELIEILCKETIRPFEIFLSKIHSKESSEDSLDKEVDYDNLFKELGKLFESQQ